MLYGVTVLESMPISILRELDMWYEKYFCEKPKNKKHDFGFEITIFPFKLHDKCKKIYCTKLYGVTVLESMPISILRELDMCMKNTLAKNPKTKNIFSDWKLRYFHLNNMVNLRKFIVPNCTASQFWKVYQYQFYVS